MNVWEISFLNEMMKYYCFNVLYLLDIGKKPFTFLCKLSLICDLLDSPYVNEMKYLKIIFESHRHPSWIKKLLLRTKTLKLLKENISLNLYDFGLADEWSLSYDTKTRSKRRDGGTEDTELTAPHEHKKYTSTCGIVLTEN